MRARSFIIGIAVFLALCFALCGVGQASAQDGARRRDDRNRDRRDPPRVEQRRDNRDHNRRHSPRAERREGRPRPKAPSRFEDYHWRYYRGRQYERRWFPRDFRHYDGYQGLRWRMGSRWVALHQRISARLVVQGVRLGWVPVYWNYPYPPKFGCDVYTLPQVRDGSVIDYWGYDDYVDVEICRRR